MRVLVSLTVLPSREREATLTLEALLHQTRPPDRIFVTLCPYYRRVKSTLPASFLNDFRWRPEISFVSAPDEGPASKFLGAPQLTRDAADILVFCDDDVCHRPPAIESIVSFLERNPGSAAGFLGRSLTPSLRFNRSLRISASTHPLPVDILMAVGMIGIRGNVLPQDLPERWKQAIAEGPAESIFLTDDIFLNAILSERKIQRYVLLGWAEKNLLKAAPDKLWSLNADGRNNDAALRYFRSAYWPVVNSRRARTKIRVRQFLGRGLSLAKRIGIISKHVESPGNGPTSHLQ